MSDYAELVKLLWKEHDYIQRKAGPEFAHTDTQAGEAARAIAALTARVAELMKERDHEKAKVARLQKLAEHDQARISAEQEMAVMADHRADTAQARLAKAVEALRPFLVNENPPTRPAHFGPKPAFQQDGPVIYEPITIDMARVEVRLIDYRYAQTTLAELETAHDKG